MRCRCVLLGQLPQLRFDLPLATPPLNTVEAGQNTLHITIQDRVTLTTRQRQDSTRSRAAYPGQRHYLFQGLRETTAMGIADLPSGLVKAACTAIIAEPTPVAEHLVKAGIGEHTHPLEASNETPVIRDYSANLRLLQHDLGHPYPVEAAVALPGKSLATVLVKPVQQTICKVIHQQAGGLWLRLPAHSILLHGKGSGPA